jgi:hypothetical protein
MFNLFFQSGVFGWLMLLCTLSVIVFTIVSANLIFAEKSPNEEKAKAYLNMVVRSGVLAAAIGFTGTIFGGYRAIWAILEATDISMRVVWEGVNIALSSTILGFSIFIISAIIWFLLKMRVLLKMT